jgi:2-C-methyl-D-erythritol 4-phosphate cytidylyltransferase
MTEEELGRLTDDASVYEKAGGVIYLVDGNRENIKITTPIDLLIAEVLMKKGRN